MSWLTGLAGKAEELLNKVDQQAATALHNEDSAAPAPKSGNHQSWESHKDSSSGASGHSSYLSPAPTQQAAMSSMTASKSVPSNLNRFDNGFNSRSRKSISSSPVPQNGSPAKKKDKDDELFEFLNSSTTVENKKPALAVKTGITNGTHSRHSSTSSSASTKSGKTTESGLTNSSLADKQGKLLLAYLYIWITSWGGGGTPQISILSLGTNNNAIGRLGGHVVLYDLNSGTYQNCSEKFTILVIPVYQDCFFWQF